jgi:hypothetical protein
MYSRLQQVVGSLFSPHKGFSFSKKGIVRVLEPNFTYLLPLPTMMHLDHILIRSRSLIIQVEVNLATLACSSFAVYDKI